MKLLRVFAPLAILLLLFVSGCGRGIQSDLEVKNAGFMKTEGGKARFAGTVTNTGKNTYSSVFVVVDVYENDDHALRLQTSANLPGTNKLTPGGTITFDKEFDDGGFKPNRYELVRLYGVK